MSRGRVREAREQSQQGERGGSKERERRRERETETERREALFCRPPVRTWAAS